MVEEKGCGKRFLGWTGLGHACGVRVQRVQRGGLTGLWPEGCGRLSAAGCVSLALKGQRPFGPRVVVSPLRAMNIKSALRDLLSVPYDMISILKCKTIQPRLQREIGLFSLG